MTGNRADVTAGCGGSDTTRRFLREALLVSGWRGPPPQIDAAVGADVACEIGNIRSLLMAFGVATRPKGGTATGVVRPEQLPCLVVNSAGLVLVAAADAGGVRAFDAVTATWREIAKEDVRGTIYGIEVLTGGPAPTDSATSWTTQFLRRMERRLLRVGGLSLVMHAASIITSLLIMFVYDNVLDTRSLDTLAAVALAIILLLVVEHHARSARVRHLAEVTARFDGAVSEMIFRHLARSPLEAVESAAARLHLVRFRRLLAGRELSLAIGVLCDIPFIMVSILLLMVIAGPVFLVPAICAAGLIGYHMLSAKRQTTSLVTLSEAKQTADLLVEEAAERMDTLREVGADRPWSERVSEALAESAARKLDHLHLTAWTGSISQSSTTLAVVLTLAACSLLAMDGLITAGALFVAMTVVWRLMGPVQALAAALPRLAQLRGTLARLDEVARAASRQGAAPPAAAPRRIEARLRVAGLGVRYGQSGAIALRQVDFAVEPGTITALVGPSGSGKTTLLRSMAGLLEVKIGSISLDGMDLRQIDAFHLAQSIGYATHDPVFFAGSVMDNMRMVRPDVTAQTVTSYLAALGLTLPSPALANGLDTRLDHGGGLALGDLQRIALVREFIKEPKLLLLDDACCAMDLVAQRAVMALLNRVKSATSVVIASASPEVLMATDRVLVLNDGVIAEKGAPGTVVPKLLQTSVVKAA